MDFNATLDLIIKDLNDAREIIDDFKKYPGIPELEVELAKSKCKSAIEIMNLLKNYRSSSTTEKKESEIPFHQEIKIFSEKVTEETVPEKRIPVEEPHDLFHETVENYSEPNPSRKHGSAIFADTFSNLPGSLNEKLGILRDEDDSGNLMKNNPLINLSDAIGLNDKFLFIREIFNGNSDSYRKAIAGIDNAGTLSDARAVLMSYTEAKEDTEAIKQLLDLVKRKFPANE